MRAKLLPLLSLSWPAKGWSVTYGGQSGHSGVLETIPAQGYCGCSQGWLMGMLEIEVILPKPEGEKRDSSDTKHPDTNFGLCLVVWRCREESEILKSEGGWMLFI